MLQEEDYLMLSGVQHFSFCPRQWALIHIEGLWSENYFTAAGRIMHDRVHDDSKFEKRGSMITVRGLKVSSSQLAMSGACDAVEFHECGDGITLNRWSGKYLPYPVEYKRGKQKVDDCDRLQVCAQAICLEEMLAVNIPSGAIYYGQHHRREAVYFSDELRSQVLSCAKKMHDLYSRQHTPAAKIGKHCDSCSLYDMCVPGLKKSKCKPIKQYFEDGLI